jgi:hypothetical protein
MLALALVAALAIGTHADVVSAGGASQSTGGFCLLGSLQMLTGQTINEGVTLARDFRSLYDLHQLQYDQPKVSAPGVEHDALLLEVFAPALATVPPNARKCRT